MSKPSLSGQRCGAGPAAQEFSCAMAPPNCASARRIELCDIETPNPTVGGVASPQGADPKPTAMPEVLQSLAQSYSPSMTLARMSKNEWKYPCMVQSAQGCSGVT